MSRTSRSFSLASMMMLVYSLFAVVAAPTPAHAQAVITVNTTRDLTGPACGTFATAARPLYVNYCSLRQALNQAINGGGNATIIFNIPSADVYETLPGFDITTSTWTITLGFIDSLTPIVPEPLTPINQPNIFIDGDSQATFGGVSEVGPRVYIDGTHEDTQGGIVASNTSNVTIDRLGIINFGGNASVPGDLDGVGIELFNVTNGLVRGCFIGVAQNGTTSAPNDAAGILIQSGSGNVIGGNNSENDEFNVISGNTNDGILIRQGATNTVVIGNRIGVNRIGNQPIPNGQNGIQIELFATGNRIGSLEDQPNSDGTLRNTIAGNGGYGIFIDRTNGNFIYGNWIGADNFFNQRIPNKSGGILVSSTSSQTASGNLIGGQTTQSRNIISGNNGPGVTIFGPLASNNVVANNWIGVGFSTTVPVSNTIGVLIQDGGDRNVIGGNGNLARDNYISGNSETGVVIVGAGPGAENIYEAQENIVSGNQIGVRPLGLTPPEMGNGLTGVFVGSYTRQTVIGGPSLDTRNVISNNGRDGIQIAGTKIVTPTIGSSTIQKNGRDGVAILGVASGDVSGATLIGVDGTPNSITQNIATGVNVLNTRLAEVRLNTITKNGAGGIIFTNSVTSTIDTNKIDENTGTGVFLNGSNDIGFTNNTLNLNTLNGFQATNSRLVTLQTNTIERSGRTGLVVDGLSRHVLIDTTDVTTSTLAGYSISNSSWVTATLSRLRGNTGGGMWMTGPLTNIDVNNNEVMLNSSHGITITGIAPTREITLTSNLLERNTGSGVRITGDLPPSGNKTNVFIRSNSVISNTVDGIHIGGGGGGPHPQRVRIRSNSIWGNGIPVGTTFPVPAGLYGLGIVLDPDTPAPGTASNPNHDIDPPFAMVISQDGYLRGRVHADGSAAACMPANKCFIQLFQTNPESLDGQGRTPLGLVPTVDASGNFTATLGFVPGQLALTATDGISSTSEFAVFQPMPDLEISPGRLVHARPSEVVTFTHRVTNTLSSNVSFTHLRVTAATNLDHWIIDPPQPPGPFALAPGQSIPVTVTVRLPSGPDAQVNAGTTGTITVTLDAGSEGPDAITRQAFNQITIDPRVVITLSEGQAKSGKPGTVVTYQHTVTNLGNISTTITPSAVTTVGGQPAPTWVTTVSPPSLTLGPGESGTVTINVTVSPGSSSGPPPNTAQTTLTVTPSGDPTQVKTVIDTTSTALAQTATMVPSRTRDATAGETVVLEHTVTNTSNGEATFKIISSVTQGSTVSYILPAAPGVTVLGANTFKLSNAPGFNTYTFSVVIQVHRSLLAGQKEFVTLSLTDPDNNPVPSTTVLDTINITRAIIYPRIYLPLIDRP